MARALFPGSFDPPTLGHLDLLRRSTRMFSGVLWAVGHNTEKGDGGSALFPWERRLELLREVVAEAGLEGVEVTHFRGLLVDFARETDVSFVLRGVRGCKDLEAESSMAMTNSVLHPGLETVFLPAAPALAHLSSSRVRELVAFGGDVSQLVPSAVLRALEVRNNSARDD